MELRAYDLTQLNVLLVDNNPFMQRLVGGILREFRVNHLDVIPSAEDAVPLLASAAPDLALVHWGPESNALEFLSMARSPEFCEDPYIPIIVLSSFTEIPHVKKARDLGMSEFLALPISARLLYQRICSVIEHPRQFVQADPFFGPDRRRRHRDFSGAERRIAPPAAQELEACAVG